MLSLAAQRRNDIACTSAQPCEQGCTQHVPVKMQPAPTQSAPRDDRLLLMACGGALCQSIDRMPLWLHVH